MSRRLASGSAPGSAPASAPDTAVPGEPDASPAQESRFGPDVEIVRVRWWHLGEIAVLEEKIFGVEGWSEELFWSELAQGASRYYVAALRAGRIVGYAGLAAHGDEAFVQTLGVAPDARRHGTATRLLVDLLRHARSVGARSCGLEVRADNDAARSLYAQAGFVDLGRRRGYYQPSGADAFVMRARPIDTPGYAAVLDRLDSRGRRKGVLPPSAASGGERAALPETRDPAFPGPGFLGSLKGRTPR